MTLQAQVEGHLYGTLNDNTTMYVSHQITKRIVEAIMMAAQARNEPTDRLFSLLKQVERVEYHEGTKTVNFYFFDRQAATQWIGDKVPLRRQLLQLHDAKVSAQAPEKGEEV